MPAVTFCDGGVAEIEKSETTNVTVVLWTSVPLVPVIVRVYVPPGVLPDVDTVRVELPAPVTEAGLKFPVAPAGRPDTLQVIVPLKPFNADALVV